MVDEKSTPAISNAMARGSKLLRTSSAASTGPLTSLMTPASIRASLSRAATRSSTRPWSLCTSRRRSTMSRAFPRSARRSRMSSVLMAMEVKGVLSWCEISASASERASFSACSSSTVRCRRAMTLSISLERMASSPSFMSCSFMSRSPARTRSRFCAMRASSRYR